MGLFRVIRSPSGRREIAQIDLRESVPRVATAVSEPEDLVGEYLATRCVVEDGAAETARDLYLDFLQWVEACDRTPMSQTAFGRRLTKLGLGRDKLGPKFTTRRLGIRLLRRVYDKDLAGPEGSATEPRARGNQN